jgi:hydrogenase expression/formation protein HypD
MKYLNEYRDPDLAAGLSRQIKKISKTEVRFMEVCGTHTVSIFRNGIKSLLPPQISLISGPGCPVCVTATQDIDKALKLCQKNDNLIITTFGDMLRVPGSKGSLDAARASGADVRIVYSPLDALELARNTPESKIIFVGVGFETTTPTIAATIIEAEKQGIENFSILGFHKLLPPALDALLDDKEIMIDGFILPGHVSIIIGMQAYQPLMDKYQIPCVVSGFEPVDILESVITLVKQIENKTPMLENAYPRAVTNKGNTNARKIIDTVFKPCSVAWRGLGVIPDSGLKIRKRFTDFDAETIFDLTTIPCKEPPGCRCGEILKGLASPVDCPLYGRQCNPANPIGPCMVSTEGTCAAYYKYGDFT